MLLLYLLVIAIVGTFFLGAEPLYWLALTHIQSGNKLVALVVELLMRGKDWDVGEFEASHPTGVVLWIANQGYGLTLKVENIKQPLTKNDRYRLWYAYKKYINGSSGTALKLASEIVAMYGIESNTITDGGNLE